MFLVLHTIKLFKPPKQKKMILKKSWERVFKKAGKRKNNFKHIFQTNHEIT